MKRRFFSALAFILVLATAFVMVGCASGPKLGTPTTLQTALNLMPAIPVLGNSLKFEFGGDTWIAKTNGKNYMAGEYVSQDAASGSVITLKQTHKYSTDKKPGIGGDVGWVKSTGPDIVLDYKKGPPESLSLK